MAVTMRKDNMRTT